MVRCIYRIRKAENRENRESEKTEKIEKQRTPREIRRGRNCPKMRQTAMLVSPSSPFSCSRGSSRFRCFRWLCRFSGFRGFCGFCGFAVCAVRGFCSFRSFHVFGCLRRSCCFRIASFDVSTPFFTGTTAFKRSAGFLVITVANKHTHTHFYITCLLPLQLQSLVFHVLDFHICKIV